MDPEMNQALTWPVRKPFCAGRTTFSPLNVDDDFARSEKPGVVAS
jgi:hypothetical protein